jgi:hypothetical protein
MRFACNTVERRPTYSSMPSLDDLLSETMLFRGARRQNLEPVPLATEGVFRSPRPNPQTLADVGWQERAETALHNPIWRFSWDPDHPGTFTDVTIRSRGMGMDYGMEMSALEKVEFRSVQVRSEAQEEPLDLYLDRAHMLGAWWVRRGTIAHNESWLWRLESELDCSCLVAFGYQVVCGRAERIKMDEIKSLGDTLIPPLGDPPRLRFLAKSDASAFVCVGPSRYIVAVELVLCKERPDFVPGEMVGFARIHPHAFVWSNEPLERAEVSIVLARKRETAGCGDETMKREIGALVVTDTNDEHSVSDLLEHPIPYTDNLYDYYETDPYRRFSKREPGPDDHPLQRRGEVTLADARFGRDRVIENAVRRRTRFVRDHRDIRKCRRQGQFDNVHLAARMRAEFEMNGREVVLDDIVMINQCLHDCVHMHVRWSEFLDSNNVFSETRMMHGWGPTGPYSQAGAPAVPRNQTVFASFPDRHSLQYRAVATDVKPGVTQVFCHHGLAYAVDEWPTVKAATAVGLLLSTIRGEALDAGEPYVGLLTGWPEFYWRVRWRDEGSGVVERLTFDLERCMQ